MVATGGYAENGHHWAHTAADYEKLLRVGSLGLIAEAEEKIAALDYTDPTAQDRRQFYLAVQVVHRGLDPLCSTVRRAGGASGGGGERPWSAKRSWSVSL